MATYNIVSVRRTPQSATVPTFTELGPINASKVTIKDYKTLQASEGNFTVSLDSLDTDTKQALRDLAAIPLEVWVYRDGERVFAGPVVGGNINGGNVTLNCRGRLYYTAYMLVTTDKSWTAGDLFTIAAELISDWQALTYGDYGIDTSGVGTMGTTRDFEVPGATEHPSVYSVLPSLAKGSFDVWVDPATGDLELAASRGTDLSSSVTIERGVASNEEGFALGAGLLASEVYATGTGAGVTAITTSKSDATLRASFGRAGLGTNHDPVVDASHLSDLADGDLAEVDDVYFTPGRKLFEMPEATYENMEPGNTVEYSYDAGLGKRTLSLRIEKRQVDVGMNGQEVISVEFE